MWSICTSSPGRVALEPYFQRCAHWPSNPRFLFGFTRPSQKRAGRIAPPAMARERMRPTVETLGLKPLRRSMACSGAFPRCASPMNG